MKINEYDNTVCSRIDFNSRYMAMKSLLQERLTAELKLQKMLLNNFEKSNKL